MSMKIVKIILILEFNVLLYKILIILRKNIYIIRRFNKLERKMSIIT